MADDRNPERGNQERPEQDPMKREDPSRELGYESPKKPGDFDQPDTADDDAKDNHKTLRYALAADVDLTTLKAP